MHLSRKGKVISFIGKAINLLWGFIKKIIRAIFIATIIMGPVLYFGIIGKPTEMGISIVASSLVLAFINIDKIEFFKGGGFEARLRDIEKVKEEAYSTIEELKKVAIPLIAETLHSINMAMRLRQRDVRQKLKAKRELDNLIQTLGLKHSRLDKEEEEFHLLNKYDLFSEFRYLLSKLSIDKKVLDILSEKQEEIYSKKCFLSEKEIYQILSSEVGKLDEESRKKMNEYLYYVHHNNLEDL